MSGYDAREMADMLACGRMFAGRTQRPHHIIDRGGKLDVVDTICPSDKVVVRDIIAPRRASDIITIETAPHNEISMAMPYVIRAVELIKAAGIHADNRPIEAEELIASLIENTAITAKVILPMDYRKRQQPLWMRFLPRLP